MNHYSRNQALSLLIKNSVSKVVEKAVLAQLLSRCERNAPLRKFQSGFRKSHATETALLKVQSDILMAMDNHKITLLVVLDLRTFSPESTFISL